jgi:abortive infection bacteriophage resistance protein
MASEPLKNLNPATLGGFTEIQQKGSKDPGGNSRAIASVYGIDEKVLQSWLHHLSLVRNICAHHSRLWNREFSIIPETPKSKPVRLAGEFITGSRKLYNTFLILMHCMDVIAPHHHWRMRLKDLITLHAIPVTMMDFPHGWEQHTQIRRGRR